MNTLDMQECRVETATDGTTVVYLYGDTSSACATYVIGGSYENKRE